MRRDGRTCGTTARRILARILALALAVPLTACMSDLKDLPYYDAHKAHHGPTAFRNPPGSLTRDVPASRFVKFVVGRLTSSDDAPPLPEGHRLADDAARAALASVPAGPRLSWIGHATFLIGIGGVNVLTDPFFSERASPVSFAGPSRFIPPGLAIADLPPIDVIAISHNHYDSFDVPALRALAKRFPDARVVVPLGLGAPVREAGFARVDEIDWYDTVEIGGARVQAVPSIHFSRRGLFDRDETLWCGFVIADSDLRIWFSGDSGAGPVFDEVARRAGPVDVALVGIGAYLPVDIMQPVHTSPEEAIELARIMGAKLIVGMHWGTLPLASDLPLDARNRFLAAKPDDFDARLMRIGETLALGPWAGAASD